MSQAMSQASKMCFALCCVLLLTLEGADARPCKSPPHKRSPKRAPPKRSPPKRSPPPPPRQPATTVTIFGDSLSDPGNEFLRSGKLIPDPAYFWNGRVSNGPVWPEYLPNVTDGKIATVFNYAYNDAFACSELAVRAPFWPSDGLPLDLSNQINLYFKQRSSLLLGVTNIMVVFMGNNDLLQILRATDYNDAKMKGELMLKCLLGNVAKLAAMGETHIVVSSFAPVDVSPLAISQGKEALVRLMVQQLDAALHQQLQLQVQPMFPNTNFSFLDMDAIVRTTISAANATGVITREPCINTVPPYEAPWFDKAGDNVTITQCASKGKGYYFNDEIHLTTEAYRSVAELVAAQLEVWGLVK